MPDLFLPKLHSFAMNNIFTGSWKEFRFRAAPNVVKLGSKEVDFTQSTILAEFWHGKLCYELSTMEGSRVFPMTEDGLAEMKTWLESNI